MDPLKNPSYLRPEVLQQQTLHSPDRPLRNSGFFRTEEQCPQSRPLPPDSLKQMMKVKIPAPMETERSAGGPESISEAANLLANAKVTRSLTTWNAMGKIFCETSCSRLSDL